MALSDYNHPSEIPCSVLVALALEHIQNFENALQAGQPNVRVGECLHYQRIWRSILHKAEDIFGWEYFSQQEKQEIYDAWAEMQ